MTAVDSRQNRVFSWWFVLVPALVLAGVGYYILQPILSPEPLPAGMEMSATVEDARAFLMRDDYALAESLARSVILADPSVADAYLIAGEAALKSGEAEAALAYFTAVPETAQAQYVTSRWSMGNIRLFQGELREAEQLYREALRVDSKSVVACERLAFILGVEGRRRESVPYLLEPIRCGQIYVEPLILLGTVDSRSLEYEGIVEQSRKVDPDYWVPLLGPARVKVYTAKYDEAEAMLREVLRHAPEQVEAHALLGSVVVERHDAENFRAWREALPPAADQHADVWFAKGSWAESHGEPEGAARCYWEAIRLDPSHLKANFRLSRLLVALGKTADAEPFGKRAELLDRLLQVLSKLYERREQQLGKDELWRAGELCESLGRMWEAWAWYSLTRTADPNDATVKQAVDRLTSKVSENPPLTTLDAQPARRVDLSSWPLPTWKTTAVEPPTEAVADLPRFVNTAVEAGLEFICNTGDDPQVPGALLAQQNGGAIAVLDYDADGWPDLFFAQCGPWPIDPSQTTDRDRLFRNQGDGTFVDVTQQALLGDTSYSQGAAVGDYDNDGWPDLFVANIGANRLYHNEGDGTFTEVTQAAGIAGQTWSTSCLIADLNGDHWSDIFVVNYLAGREPLETECYVGKEKRACSPANFPAAEDQLLLGLGDGRFADVTAESGILAPDGKGLGLVAVDLHGTGQLSLYVSNDTTANFYFVNQTGQPGGPPRFQESALLAGLAFDRDGAAQASMGIAVGDGDEDGLLDLFVTSFMLEANTYYRQIAPDLFQDASDVMGLRDASIGRLTFGAQFIDFELDGRLDLVTACGHVDDFRYKGEPYKMQPQAFANRGQGQFVELDNAQLGPFFEGEYLGRALALLDVDRDGKQDFAVLNLGDPAALVVNRTPTTGHYLALHLRGVECQRDAIGATVHAVVGPRTLVRQLTAGDGFQCSNQHIVHVGLGDAARIDQLQVRWPNGRQQTFDDVPADREVMLVEGAAELMDLPRDRED